MSKLTTWLSPHRAFFIFSLAFGLLYLVVTPPFRAPDEPGHYKRVLAYGHGELWERYQTPKAYRDFFEAANDARPANAGHPVRHTWKTLAPILTAGQGPDKDAKVKFASNGPTVALYSPTAYLPAIGTTWIALKAGVSPVVAFYVMRLALLLASCWLMAWAIRRLPCQQWSVAAAMLLPTPAWSRAMVTADSLTVAVCLAFIALLLGGLGKINARRDVALILLGGLAVALSKIVFATLLGLLFLPGRFYGYAKRRRWRLPMMIGAAGASAALAWSLAAGRALERALERGAGIPSNPRAQLDAMMADPGLFPRALGETLGDAQYVLVSIGKSMIGILGELDVPLDDSLCAALAAGVLALVWLDTPRSNMSALSRLFCLGIFCATFLLTMLALYLQWNAVGAPRIEGFQGRYLFPVLPLLFLALAPPAPKRMPAGLPLAITVIVAMVGNTAALETLIAAFYE